LSKNQAGILSLLLPPAPYWLESSIAQMVYLLGRVLVTRNPLHLGVTKPCFTFT